MKAPAFQWYAAEYLADEQVAQLSLLSEAIYVRLLSYCWREGTIPANPVQCVALCKYADVKDIKPALNLFMKAPGQPGRLIHKRLEEERDKQEAYRAKQSAKGLMGGRPRKADDKPGESYGKATALQQLNNGLTTVKPGKSSSISSSTSSTTKERSTNDDSASPSSVGGEILKAGKRGDVLADPALSFESFWDLYAKKEGPKSKIAKKWDALPATDRKRIMAHLSDYRTFKTTNGPQYMPDPQTFLNGKLWESETYGQPAPGPRQTPNDIPSNWPANLPYVLPPTSMGIPNISSMLKPEFQIN